MTAQPEYAVVWNGSHRGRDADLFSPIDGPPCPPAKRPARDTSDRRPPWERAGLARSTYYRRRAASRPVPLSDLLALLVMLCGSGE